jgi:Adenylate and Guanylate cyclase catalytic domain
MASNPTFTYRIDGPLASYLGKGDHHESTYDSLAVSSYLSDVDEFYVRPSKYTGLPLDRVYCPFHVTVYPSSSMEAEYTSTNPIYYTLGAALIFAFTTGVFLMFDCFVERRQRKVMTTVVRSNKIIASLFPSVVRDRLYITEERMDGSDQKKVFKLASPTTRLKSFLNEGTTSGETDETEVGGAAGIQGEPIAELYPDCTVLFCDIQNFTAWSSARNPQQVFKLLETIYCAFDAIAKRRGVFKVETIGDSYVAVCGLPEPRDDHAVVMARFARDCRDCMNELTRRLESSLGPDTGDLKVRKPMMLSRGFSLRSHDS